MTRRLRRTLVVAIVALATAAVAVPVWRARDDGTPPPPPPRPIVLAQRLCDAEPTLFGAEPTDDAVATKLLQGRLRLAPHRAVALPDDPTWAERLVDQDNWEARYQSLTWLDPLRREFVRTGDRALLDRYRRLLRDFTTHNTTLTRPASPWTWYDHPSGHRASVLTCATSVLGTPEWLVRALRLHADVISRPDQYKGWGNHSLMQNSGLFSVGCVLDEHRYRALARRRSERLLARAIDEEGVLDEGSYAYQVSNHRWWSELRDKLDVCGARTGPSWDRIDRMPAFIAHSTQPTGRATPFGDTHVGQGGAPSGPRRPRATTVFYERGYLLSRSGWATDRPAEEESMVSLRYGQSYDDQPHGHRDAGNIEFFAYGTPLVTDSGMHAHGSGFWRSWVKSPFAHNVLTADGASYLGDRRSPLLQRQTSGGYTLATIGSPVIEGVDWYRTVLYSRRGHWLLVEDRFDADRERVFRQRWNLPGGAAFDIDGTRIDQTGAGPGITIKWLVGAAEVRIVEGKRSTSLEGTAGWRSHSFGAITPAPAAIASRRAQRGRFITLIASRAKGEPASSIEVHGMTKTPRGIKLTIVTPRGRERIWLEPEAFIAG